MARFRLRFLLQEFDLPRGVTLIGRSSECQVTIEDPLVSRQHARIVLEDDEATLEDLGSRNGVKLNGVAIPSKSKTTLKDGDRLRIGTQELVFCRVEQSALASAKATGFLRHCALCRLPYPKEMVACPSCGATEQTDDDTLSGQFGASSQGAWSVQLLIEVLDKALSLGRAADAERILRRASAQLEERVVEGESVEPQHLEALSVAAAKLSSSSNDPTWGSWIAQIHRRVSRIPSTPVVDALAGLAAKFPEEVGESIEKLTAHTRGQLRSLSPEDSENLARLEGLGTARGARALLSSGTNPTLS